MRAHISQIAVLFCTLVVAPVVFAQEEAPKPKPPPSALVPQFSFRARDGKLLAQMMQKNKWFLEFRQTPFYQGAVGRMAPVLFSPADEGGSAASAWQGRLLDYLYEKMLENRPVGIHFFRRSSLSSPFAITVSGLSKTEISLAEKMISTLKSGDAQKFSYADSGEVSVTPLLVKQQKFGVVLNGGCLSVGRAPEAVASASYLCGKMPPLKTDGELRVSIDESMPAFRGVREKFLGVKPEAVVDMKWQSSDARFAVQQGRMDLGDSTLQKAKVPEDLLHVVPANAFFFTTAMMPMPAGGFGPEGLKTYFQSGKAQLKNAPVLPVGLVYMPVHTGDKSAAATALILHVPKNTAMVVKQLAESFKPKKDRETFIRATCGGVVALSQDKGALDALEAVCKKERPSYSQMAGKWTAPFASPISGAAYLNPGQLLSQQMEKGWRRKKDQDVAAEVKSAQHLVEQLPSYLLSGTAEAKSMSLKAVE